VKEYLTENPSQLIWQMLLRFTYIDVINNWWLEKGEDEDEDLAFFIASSFQQGKSYFDSSYGAQINIKPLLLYYASVNLLIGTLSLVKHKKFKIYNHGMILDDNSFPSDDNIFPISLIPKNKDGALYYITSEMEGITDLLDHGKWSLEEIFRAIPDLQNEYQYLFPELDMNIIPIEEVFHDERFLDRIPIKNSGDAQKIIQKLKTNINFSLTYLDPQITQKYIILNRKPGSKTFEQYSITGERFLPIPFNKKGRIFLPQYIMIYLGLYILGTLSRYHPEIWDGFLRKDITGKRNLIISFLQVSERYFPNLLLNIITGERIQFKI
jgi:hypothetical protein